MNKQEFLQSAVAKIDCAALSPAQIATEISGVVFAAKGAGLEVTVFEVGQALRLKRDEAPAGRVSRAEWKRRMIEVVIENAAREGESLSPAAAAARIKLPPSTEA